MDEEEIQHVHALKVEQYLRSITVEKVGWVPGAVLKQFM